MAGRDRAIRCTDCESFVEVGHVCDGLPGITLTGKAKWVFLIVLAVILVACVVVAVLVPGLRVPLFLGCALVAMWSIGPGRRE